MSYWSRGTNPYRAVPNSICLFPGNIQSEVSDHGDVFQMSRAETKAYGEVGGAGEHNGDLPVLWYTYGFGEKMQIPLAGLYCIL